MLCLCCIKKQRRFYILPLSAATPPARAFSLAESRGISEMLSTRPESRLSVFKYSVFTTLQISNTEERGQTAFITPLLSCSVPGNICNRGCTGIVSKIQNCVDQSVSCPVYPAFDVGDRPHWT